MNIRYLIAGFFTWACFAISSCSDENYSPITLAYAEENGEMPIDQNNHLSITPFSKGESFTIHGGSGDYHIKAANKNVVNFHYDGDTLTILPVSQIPDSGDIIITDRSRNSYILIVDIEYRKRVFEVAGIEASVQGNSLTLEDAQKIKKAIINNAQVSSGSQYILTYTEDDETAGEVVITPQGLKGTFIQGDEWQGHEGQSFTQFSMTLGNIQRNYDLYTTRNPEDVITAMELQEDVTSVYKTTYPNLTKAACILKIVPPIPDSESLNQQKK